MYYPNFESEIWWKVIVSGLCQVGIIKDAKRNRVALYNEEKEKGWHKTERVFFAERLFIYAR